MKRRMLAGALALLSSAAMAQTPGTPAPKLPDGAATLGWMQGVRVHTNADGSDVREAFIGPINGVVTGTAVSAIGADRAYTEYHKIGPNADGVYGLDVANTRSGMKWNFTPLKGIDPDRITFQTADGALTISYAKAPGNGIDAKVIRVADGKAVTQEWHFKAAK
jgi:hypothetical protein